MRKERISRKARVVICAIEDTSTVIPQLAQNTNYYTWENTKKHKGEKRGKEQRGTKKRHRPRRKSQEERGRPKERKNKRE
jgi:hypothetical protein